MASGAVVVRGVTGTGSTTDITSSGLGTPSGAIVFLTSATADNTDTGGNSQAVILFDGTSTVCLFSSDEDNVTDSNNTCGLYTSVIFRVSGTTTSALGTIANTTDGIQISWSDTPNASYKYVAVLFRGGLQVKVGTQQMSGTIGGTATYAGTSFTPQAGIFLSHCRNSLNSNIADAIYNMGLMTYVGSTITQRALAYGSYDAAATADLAGMAANNRVEIVPFDAGDSEEGEITAVSSSGFTITTRRANYASYVGFMLFGGLKAVNLADTAVPSATGIKSWEGPGFSPNFLLMAQSGLPSFNTRNTSLDWAHTIGVTDGTTEGSIAGWADAGAFIMDTGNRHSTTLLTTYQTTYNAPFSAAFSSFDSLGYNVNYTAVDTDAYGRVGFSLAFQFSDDAIFSGLLGVDF